MKMPVILIVNSNQGEMEALASELHQEGYDTVGAVNLSDLDKALRSRKGYVLALLDISGFDDSIWERGNLFQASKTPFIIIGPQRSSATQRQSMKYGAAGILVKPVSSKELIEHIHSTLGD